MAEASRTFVRWPAVVVAVLAAAMVVGGFLDLIVFSIFILPPAGLLALLAGVPALALTIVSIIEKRFRRAASYAVLPAVAIAAFFAPRAVIGPLLHVGERFAFEINRGEYDAAVAKSPLPVGKRFVVFDWDGFGGINTFLIFDESDALARNEVPENGRSMAQCAAQSVRFTGHYYLCTD